VTVRKIGTIKMNDFGTVICSQKFSNCRMKKRRRLILWAIFIFACGLFTLGYLANKQLNSSSCPEYILVGTKFHVLKFLDAQTYTIDAIRVDTLHIGGHYGFVLDLDFLDLNSTKPHPYIGCMGPPSVVRDSILKIELEAIAENQHFAITDSLSAYRREEVLMWNDRQYNGSGDLDFFINLLNESLSGKMDFYESMYSSNLFVFGWNPVQFRPGNCLIRLKVHTRSKHVFVFERAYYSI
jgi:hypothetical protein